MRRIFWTLVGLGAGAAIGVAVARWAGRTKERYAPPALARQAGSRMQELGERLRDALDEGRREMIRREAELRVEMGLEQEEEAASPRDG